MATYNGERFIKEQIDSILIQLKEDDELVISDDQSKDSTIQLIKTYNDQRIKLHIHEKPDGPIKNFQNALEKAKGDYIFLADQDDVWVDGKYQKMCALLKEYDMVLSDSIVVDEDKRVLHKSFFKLYGSGKGVLRNVLKTSYFGSCMAFRRSLLDYALPFPSTNEMGHDIWLGLVAEMTGKVCFLNEGLLLYRRHPDTVTAHGRGGSTRSLYTKITGRMIMFGCVAKFYIKHLLNGKRTSFYNNPNV